MINSSAPEESTEELLFLTYIDLALAAHGKLAGGELVYPSFFSFSMKQLGIVKFPRWYLFVGGGGGGTYREWAQTTER